MVTDAPTSFEWDADKAASNLEKHGVSFDVALDVFLDRSRVDVLDNRSNYGEERRNVIGIVGGISLFVSYTMRGDVCRIVSARRASRKER